MFWVSFSSGSIQFKFEGNIKVFLQGATIKTDEETGKIVIARVMHGGAADRSGLIHVGDEVVEVNNINVEGKTPNDVLKILVTFKCLQFHKSHEFKVISEWLCKINDLYCTSYAVQTLVDKNNKAILPFLIIEPIGIDLRAGLVVAVFN